MKRRTIGLIICILVVVIVGAVFYYVYSFSGNKADVILVDLALEASDSQTFLSDLLSYKKFKFTLAYDVLGGFVPVTCRDLTLNVKIEDLDVGSVEIDDFQISGWWNTKTETVLLDVSDLSSNDLLYIRNKLSHYRNELKVEIEWSSTIDAIVVSKTVDPSISKYFLLGSPSINLANVYWGRHSAQAGELVDFHVVVSNPYRGSQVSGTLAVIVREDIAFAYDRDVKTYSFSVVLSSEQSKDCSDSFAVYKDWGTRGFFLKVYWEGIRIYEMGQDYPPRLEATSS